MQFTKAVRKKSKLRLALSAPSGAGKTLGALMIAKGMDCKKIAIVDTERGSASLYADDVTLRDGSVWTPPEFDALDLTAPFSPEVFIEAINAASAYDCLIIDGITPEWNGVGGCLELVDQIAKAKYRGNSWSAWNDVTPRHRKFIDAMLGAPMHIIATMRSKTETAQVEENGRKKVAKLGMKAEQRDGIEFEFTTVLDLIHDGHFASASKDRTGVFSGDPKPISEEAGAKLRAWMESAADAPKDEAPKAAAHKPNPLDKAREEIFACNGVENAALVRDSWLERATKPESKEAINQIFADYEKSSMESA